VNVGTGSADLILNRRVLLVVVVDVKTKTGRVNSAVTPDEEGTEDRLGDQVENTVEDGLRVRRDDVATLADTPGDGVEDPEQSGERATQGEAAADILSENVGVAATLPDENPDDVEESNAAKDEVAPLVGAADEGTNKTSNDHDFIDENDEEKSGPRHCGGQHQVEEKERGGDEPIDVADVEDLTVDTADLRHVRSAELNIDGGPAEVGSHREVGNSGDHGDGSGDVVEDTVLTRLGHTQAQEDEGGSSHGSADSPVPVGTANGDGDVRRLAIDQVGCEDCQHGDSGNGQLDKLTVDVQSVISLGEVVHLMWIGLR
jgi:hypothetical protein